jgi:effector-binding domain-containing protein
MRILKYLFLLVLLALLGMTVYVATQKGDFEVVTSRIVKAQRSTVFDYINDYRNWETFGSWMKKGAALKFDYGSKSVGAGGKCRWFHEGDQGNLSTYYVKENDSIAQKGAYNQTHSYVYWTFKDTVGGTKVSIHCKGQMDLFSKVSFFFKGGIERLLHEVCEESLHNLDKTLDYELKTYAIKVNGISQRVSGYCLKQTLSSKVKNVGKNIKIVMPRMVHFFKKNRITMQGKPFVLYERYDKANDFVTFSVCIPTTKQIYLMPGSDVTSGEIVAFTCLKTTLVGDHSHTQEAWAKARKYIADHQLKENIAGYYSEVYVKTIDDVKQPSKWITEIYIPVFPIAEALPAVAPAVNQAVPPLQTTSPSAAVPTP